MNWKKNRKVKFASFCLLCLLISAGCGGGGGSTEQSQESQDYSLSGTVIPADDMTTDSDVNDPYAAYESNDQFYQAQELSAPIRVSGYVNQAGEGPSGRSYSQGDPEDIFVAELSAGTTISLYMAEDPASADLSLYLYDDGENLKAASLTQGEAVDSVSVPADGVYYIRVEATEAASVYVLTVGDAGAQAAFPLRLSDEFAPGEVIVRLAGKAESSVVSSLSANGGEVSAMGLYTRAGASERDRLMKRAGPVDTPAFFRGLGVQDAVSRSLSMGKLNAAAREKMETLWMVRALQKMPGVQYAEPNYLRRALATTPNDPYYSYYQWNLRQIHLPEAWDITKGDADVVVAVVDTGVLSAHPDLDGQLMAGYDFVDGDADPEDEDESFHGTHVAGIVAAESNNGQGVAGVAWHARIMPLRVLDENGEGSNWDILQAVQYAAGIPNASGKTPSSPADIINLSLGGSSSSQVATEVYEAVRKKGVIVVAASGSVGTNAKMYPAAYDSVVSVSAVTKDGQRASYSNYGVAIDVAAPGGDWTNRVYSTIGELDSDSEVSYTYGELAGTSMAAPHVSGVAALMKSLYSGLTPLEFEALLQGEYLTRDLGESHWDEYYGYGLIDAYKAVQEAKAAGDAGELRPLLYASPGRLDFSALGSLLYVTVRHAGGGSLSVTDFYGDESWMLVSGAAGVVDEANGLNYTVEVSREGLSDGVYTGAITFETSGDPLVVPVRMEVGEASGALNGGFHYVMIVDPDTDEAVDLVGSGGEDGVYPYEFADLSYGETYVIVAGTDPDNDGYICEDGEACGRYPAVDDPMEIEVVGSQSGLNFYSEIQAGISSFDSLSAGTMALPLLRDNFREVAK